MLRTLLGGLWRGAPSRVRRWGVWVVEPRFAATAGRSCRTSAGACCCSITLFGGAAGWRRLRCRPPTRTRTSSCGWSRRAPEPVGAARRCWRRWRRPGGRRRPARHHHDLAVGWCIQHSDHVRQPHVVALEPAVESIPAGLEPERAEAFLDEGPECIVAAPPGRRSGYSFRSRAVSPYATSPLNASGAIGALSGAGRSEIENITTSTASRVATKAAR